MQIINEYFSSGRIIFFVILAVAIIGCVRLFNKYSRILAAFGSVSSRWSLRFQCRDYADIQSSVQGCYFTLEGHTRNCIAVLAGRLHSIAINILNLNFEIGSGFFRKVSNRTLVITDLNVKNCNLIFLYQKEIVPAGNYMAFSSLSSETIAEMAGLTSSARSYLKNCLIYTDNPDMAAKVLVPAFINHMPQMNGLDFEIFRDKLIVSIGKQSSKFRLSQVIARTIRQARIINKSFSK